MKNKLIAQLHGWADEGTKESIKKIEEYRDNAYSEDQKAISEIALEEATFHYFSPENEQEERDYELCHLICERNDEIIDHFIELEDAKFELMKINLDMEVQQRMSDSGANKEIAKLNNDIASDLVALIQAEIDDSQQKIAYAEAWIDAAKGLITSPKYLDKELDIFEHIEKSSYEDITEPNDDCICSDCIEEDLDDSADLEF